MQTLFQSTQRKSFPKGDGVDWLHKEYCDRKKLNGMYSMRAFARALKLSPGLLSDILSRKRTLSPLIGQRIATRLEYSMERRQEFLHRIQKVKIEKINRSLPTFQDQSFVSISEDSFEVVSDWYHNGILSLMETQTFRNDLKWIAARLGISTIEARDAIGRLIRVGLALEQNGLLMGSPKTTTTHNISSEAIRKSHRQHMNLAAASLDTVDVSERDITSISMAADVSKIPLAKEMIKKFRRDLANELEVGTCSEVYCLNIQLFPLTKKEVH